MTGEEELLEISSGTEEFPYNWSAGHYWSKFFKGLRDEKTIYGIKCPSCGKVYVPPREICGRCFVRMSEWVDLGTEGVIEGFSVVRYPYINPSTGKPKKIPFTSLTVRLDGADTSMSHYLDETDEKKIAIGRRVKAVFREQRTGTIHDIEHFTLWHHPV